MSENPKEKLYLIDGTNLIFRAYYAIRHLSTSKGFPTNAIYGFTNMLLKLIKDEKPDHLGIVFDSGKPTFREEIYPEYKANREAPPDDLIQQFPHIPRVVDALNIPNISMEGVEADDVIGTLAKRAEAKGKEVVIVTGDKDFMQLVSENVSLLDTMKERKIGPKEVVEKFGVEPSKVTDVLGLMGDSSDNIPGVHGIGPKTATKLIQQFETLEKLLDNSKKLEGGIRDKIEKHIKEAKLSKKLATIHTDVKVDVSMDDLTIKPPKQDELREIFKEFEFSALLSELAPKEKISRDKYLLVESEKDLAELKSKLIKAKRFAFDTETTSLDPFRAELVGISFSWAKGEAAYIPVGHTGLDSMNQPERGKVLDALIPLFEDESLKKIGQNLKYDLAVLSKYGVNIKGIECDTMIASYVLNPAGPHNMDDLSQQFLDHTTIKYEDVTGKGKNQINFSEVDIERACKYSAEDADVTLRLADIFLPEIKGSKVEQLFFEMEMPLMEVLLKMERIGVKVDAGLLKQMGRQFTGELKKLEDQIFELAEGPFNINSPKQLGVILFEKLELPGGKKTKTGYSTDIDTLTSLSEHHKMPKLILEYRSLAKLMGTYIDALPTLIDPRTGRIHTSYNQTVAETGRLSSSEPNLQNIPIRTEAGKRIREAFVAEKGFLLLSADYSQIELRILAHIADEEELITAFKNGQDVHSMTAAGIFDVAPSKVSSEQRSVGKTVNFATIYGQSAFGLSKQLKIPVPVAQAYIDNYFRKYPSVARYRDKAMKSARKNGFVETLYGRRRYVPDINSKNQSIRQNAERMAFNTIFQGTAADVIKRAMIEIDRKLGTVSPESKMILQVHDELVFEVPEKEAEKVKKFVAEEMENAASLKVPLTVDVGVGKNWSECG